MRANKWQNVNFGVLLPKKKKKPHHVYLISISAKLFASVEKTISFININRKWKYYRVMKNKPGMSKISNGNICCLYLRLRIYTFSLKMLWSVAKSCEKLLTPEPLQPLLSPPPPQHHQQDEEQHHSHQNAGDRHHHLHPLVAGLLHRALHRSLHQRRNGAFCKHI